MNAQEDRVTSSQRGVKLDAQQASRRDHLRTAGIISTAVGFLGVVAVVLIAASHERNMKLVPLGIEDLRRENSGAQQAPAQVEASTSHPAGSPQ